MGLLLRDPGFARRFFWLAQLTGRPVDTPCQTEEVPAKDSADFEPGARVLIPDGLNPPFGVYVNGIAQQSGTDFRIEDRHLLFRNSLVQEGPLGFWRWFAMLLGIRGTYRPNDSVDLTYRAQGRGHVVTHLPIETLIEIDRSGPLKGSISFEPTRR